MKDVLLINLLIIFFCIVFGIVIYPTDKDRERMRVAKAVEENNYTEYVLYEKIDDFGTGEPINPHYFAVVNAVQTEQGTVYTTDKGEIIIDNLDGITWTQDDGTSNFFSDGIIRIKPKKYKQIKQSNKETTYTKYVLYEDSTEGSAHYFSVVNAVQTEQGTIYTTNKGEIIMENPDRITWIHEDGTSKFYPDGIMKKWSDQD